jgi:predicted nucleic acid-binding protein
VSETAVADSSCLIGLSRIDQVGVLLPCFDRVIVPPEVSEEVGPLAQGIEIVPVHDAMAHRVLRMEAGKGEAAAIALALETPDATVILDDLEARLLARRLGVRVMGTVGVLIRSKKLGLVPEVGPLLGALRSVGFHLSDDLITKALELAGEQ